MLQTIIDVDVRYHPVYNVEETDAQVEWRAQCTQNIKQKHLIGASYIYICFTHSTFFGPPNVPMTVRFEGETTVSFF